MNLLFKSGGVKKASSPKRGESYFVDDVVSIIISFIGNPRDLARFSRVSKVWNHWCSLSLASTVHQQTKETAKRKLAARIEARNSVNHDYYLMVMGGSGVGKTALVIRFIHDRFDDGYYDCGIEDTLRKQVNVDEEICMLYITDTAGQEAYSHYWEYEMQRGEGFLLVYSIAERRYGFDDEIERIYEQIERVKECEEGERIPIVLVGNKLDLKDRREISKGEGIEMAEKLGFKEERGEFFETSAKTGIHVEEAFFSLVRLIRTARLPALPCKPVKTPPNRCTLC